MTEKNLVLKKVDVLSFALLSGIGLAVTIFIFVLIIMLIMMPIMLALGGMNGLGGGFGLATLLFVIPIYFIIGFIFGAIGALTYNLIIVKMTGGLKLTFEDN